MIARLFLFALLAMAVFALTVGDKIEKKEKSEVSVYVAGKDESKANDVYVMVSSSKISGADKGVEGFKRQPKSGIGREFGNARRKRSLADELDDTFAQLAGY